MTFYCLELENLSNAQQRWRLYSFVFLSRNCAWTYEYDECSAPSPQIPLKVIPYTISLTLFFTEING